MKDQHRAYRAYPARPAAVQVLPSGLGAGRPRRSLGNTALALLSAQGITWTTTFIGILLIPRLLGDSNLGLYAVAVTLAGFVGVIAGFGTGSHIVKEIARDPSRTADIVAHAAVLRVLWWLGITVPLLAGARAIGTDSESMLVLAAVMTGALIALMSEVATSALQGNHRVGRSQLSLAAFLLAGQGLAVGLLLLGAGVIGYSWLTSTLVPIISLVVLVALLRKVMRGTVRLSPKTALGLLGAGAPFLAWNLAQFSYANASALLLASLASRADTGVFTFAFRIAAIPVFVATIIVATTFATLAETARADPSFFRRLLTQATRTTIVAIVPASVGIALVCPQLAGLIGGEEFKRAGPAIAILALQAPSIGIGTVMGTGLIALDRQRSWAVVGWAAALSNIGFTALGIIIAPQFGVSAIAGAAVANLVIDVSLMVAAWVLIGDNIDRAAVLQVSVRTAVACGVMAAVVWVLLPVNLVLAVVAGAAVYALAVFVTRAITVDEIRRLIGERGAVPDLAEGHAR